MCKPFTDFKIPSISTVTVFDDSVSDNIEIIVCLKSIGIHFFYTLSINKSIKTQRNGIVKFIYD